MNEFIFCSFCGKSKSEASHIIAGKKAYICMDCVFKSTEVINKKLDEERKALSENQQRFPTPKEIHKKLDDYVIFQEEAKKTLSVIIYNHYNRILHNYKITQSHQIELDKSNILIIGESGTGKTLLASTIAKIINVPFAIADATTLTEAGYVGDDVENILLRLMQNADFDVKKAEKGIIFIDEIDKIGRKSENPSITRDVSGEGVQQALLKIIEGTIASVPIKGGRKHPQSQNIDIDTKNILFICGGAFIGLDKIISNRIQKSSIGFQAKKSENLSKENFFSQVNIDDLIKYGLIPELVGRLPIVTSLKKLTPEALKSILIKPKNSILKQYEILLKLIGLHLEIKEDALDYIAEQALKVQTGGRALRSIIESFMLEIIYEAPEKIGYKIILSKKNILKNHFFYPFNKKKSKNKSA